MEEKILNILKNNSDYISGEFISTSLNVSRTAIWKHIKSLKSKGYNIDGISNKGYKLISSPDLLNKSEILSLLKTNIIGKNIVLLDNINSTNIKAKELAKKGAPDGTIIISEEQNSGTGRFGRNWVSPKGGLWLTIILRPKLPPSEAPKITQIAAAAVYKTLKNFNISSTIKWPNDLLLNGKKICGILSEMKCDMDQVHYLVLGIGLNINIDKDFFNGELSSICTSLQIEFNKKFNRAEILCELLSNFEILYNDFITDLNISETIKICRDNSNIFGKQAKLITYNNEEIVTCISLSDTGNLIVKDSNGKEKVVIAGEISFNAIK